MGKSTVPEHHIWHCDLCDYEVLVFRKAGRPPHWTKLMLKRDAYDGGDVAVADASVELYLCQPCTGRVITAINSMKELGKIR